MAYADLVTNPLVYWSMDNTIEPTAGVSFSNVENWGTNSTFYSAYTMSGGRGTIPVLNGNTKFFGQAETTAQEDSNRTVVSLPSTVTYPLTFEAFIAPVDDSDSISDPGFWMYMFDANSVSLGRFGIPLGTITAKKLQLQLVTTNGTYTITDIGSNVPSDQWSHVACVIPSADLREVQFYLNGVLNSTPYTTATTIPATWQVTKFSGPWLDAGGSSGGAGSASFIGLQNAAVYNRACTTKELAARQTYRYGDPDYDTVVLADNPSIYLKFNDYPVTNLGSAGGTGSGASGANITRPTSGGIDDSQYLAMTYSSPNTANVTNFGTTINTYTQSSMTSPNGYSYEFFVKIPPHNPAVATTSRRIVNALSAGSGNQYLPINFASPSIAIGAVAYRGIMDATVTYLSGSTSWITGSLSTFPRNQFKNFADNEWHHVVFTFSRINRAQLASMYMDGALVRQRTLPTSTATWEAATPAVQTFPHGPFYFGDYSAGTSDGRTIGMDNFAVYDKALSASQVAAHWYAYATTPMDTPIPGQVRAWDGTAWQLSSAQKVWDGTAWVDWTASYYDGTSWISI